MQSQIKLALSILLIPVWAFGQSKISDTEWACAGFGHHTIPPPPPLSPSELEKHADTAPNGYDEQEAKRFRQWRDKNWCLLVGSLFPAPGHIIKQGVPWKRIVVIRTCAWFGQTYQICIATRPNGISTVNYWGLPQWSYVTDRMRQEVNTYGGIEPSKFAKSLNRAEGCFELDLLGSKALAALLQAKRPKKLTMPNPDDVNFWILVLSKGSPPDISEFFGSQDADIGFVASDFLSSISSKLKAPLSP